MIDYKNLRYPHHLRSWHDIDAEIKSYPRYLGGISPVRYIDEFAVAEPMKIDLLIEPVPMHNIQRIHKPTKLHPQDIDGKLTDRQLIDAALELLSKKERAVNNKYQSNIFLFDINAPTILYIIFAIAIFVTCLFVGMAMKLDVYGLNASIPAILYIIFVSYRKHQYKKALSNIKEQENLIKLYFKEAK